MLVYHYKMQNVDTGERRTISVIIDNTVPRDAELGRASKAVKDHLGAGRWANAGHGGFEF